MNTRWKARTSLIVCVLAVASILMSSRINAQSSARPITAADFHQAAPRGFGDRYNSWAQSMIWWHDHLYVGTGRQALCTSFYSVYQFVAITLGRDFANTWFPYPNSDPDLSCEPDGADLAIQAEIWRWAPDTDWERVFQSPLDLDHPGGGSPLFPPEPGKKVPYEISFRGMKSFIEPDGTDALYAFGVNSTIMWDRTKLPPPRILRSTDGVTFTPIPQTPGTFLGDLPFNPDHSSFRSPVSFNGKLFVLSGPVFGQGTLIGSDDPAKGDDAWFLASPPGLIFYEMSSFNGWLYLGTLNPITGYSVVKTRAEGTPPYTFQTVIPAGAFLPDRPAKSVVSMQVYNGRLYVGTATQTEIIRINPDDTWDLVVGTPRNLPLVGGGVERKSPISGLDAGFGHTLNDHAWQMEDPFRFLYVGTYNASIASKDDPLYGPLLEHNMGAHLYRTQDGWYFSALTTNGFKDPLDPYGGKFDYGIRTMATTPHGAFFGTANDHYGLMIFRANTSGDNAPNPPELLEIEPALKSGGALLSWVPTPSADNYPFAYQIWRAEIRQILVRDDVNFEAWNGTIGNKIPDTYVTPYVKIGTTSGGTYIDTTVEAGKRYMYYVLRDHQGRISDQSNLVTFPLLTPPVTFAQLFRELDKLDVRHRFIDSVSKVQKARQTVVDAKTNATACRLTDAIKLLNQKKTVGVVLEPDATDIEVLSMKLARRLTLFGQMRAEISTTEFCTP